MRRHKTPHISSHRLHSQANVQTEYTDELFISHTVCTLTITVSSVFTPFKAIHLTTTVRSTRGVDLLHSILNSRAVLLLSVKQQCSWSGIAWKVTEGPVLVYSFPYYIQSAAALVLIYRRKATLCINSCVKAKVTATEPSLFIHEACIPAATVHTFALISPRAMNNN